MKGAKTIQDFTLAPTIQSTVPEKHLRSGVQWQERLADPGSSRATRSQVDRHSALLTKRQFTRGEGWGRGSE